VCDQPGLAQHIEDRLRKLDSPITIAVELGRGVWGPQGTVSHETIDRASRQVWLAPLRHGHGADTVCSAATWARAPNSTS
jgi:hypothetical protein